jgi:hypothetical protein
VTSNPALASSAPTSIAHTATSTSTKKGTAPVKRSNARTAGRTSGAARFDESYFATRGRAYTRAEMDIIKRSRHLKTRELQALLPGRTRYSIAAKRNKSGFSFRRPPFTRGEDEEIRRSAPTKGATGIHHILPHRTPWEISQRAKALGISLFNFHERPLAVVGEPLADAIRQRAREDGLSMRGLDCELGTAGYFTNVASHRAKRGSGPYMPAIRKAIAFFEAELVTGPGGTSTIDWKDK